jgi:MinD superfamily P-loop ATPase
MKIAILSGKGGTGKTLVSVNLASVLEHATYVDCDVEEPNGHLFFKPHNLEDETIMVKIPVVDFDKCTGCRTCVSFCKFNALAYIGNRVKVFDNICHACGGCQLVCPEHAIYEIDKNIGTIKTGESDTVHVITGILNTGEESGVPIIKKLLEKVSDAHQTVILDCPPGSSCMVMESIKTADYCVLVAEPTTFGAHNLKMVYELVTLMGKPHGCVLNKVLDFENPSEDFCKRHEIPIVGRFPFDADMGRTNAEGEIISRVDDAYKEKFLELFQQIELAVSV